MIRSLTLKWVLTLALTSLVGVILIAVVFNTITAVEFDQLLIDQAQTAMADAAARYYANNGSLDGFHETARQMNDDAGSGDSQGRRGFSRRGGPPDGSEPAPGLVLVDGDGSVVSQGAGYDLDDQVPAEDIKARVAVMVDGAQVGEVYFVGGLPELDTREKLYIATINRAILFGAAAAVGVSALVGILLSRGFLRPLRALTRAVQGMHAGQLEQRVEVRSRDELGALAAAFNEMSAEVARANQLRKQMTADIAHDLRSPLTVIAGYLEGLRDGTLKPTPARFDTMYAEAVQLGHLIEDLRTLSLADAGELRLVRQSINPQDLIRAAAQAFQPAAEARGITLSAEAAPDLGAVPLDRERMNQVLANLIGNALRYARSHITLRAGAERGAIRLSIEDDGAGIPPEKLPFIFERLYRADESRASGDGESGLGLAIARAIIEAHGGTIQASSAAGRGTQFTILLPAGA
ncbi:MAG: HAMP domain-containing protein [Anaerolineae bacterium]|nr:HAMP domain-containing protein [Anaerolineae bacterium]